MKRSLRTLFAKNNFVSAATFSCCSIRTLSATSLKRPALHFLVFLFFIGGVGKVSGQCIPPEVSINPIPQHICQTETVIFTGSFTGSEPITYQWEYYDDNLMLWQPITNAAPFSGATTTTLTITSPAFVWNGFPFHLIATNECGSEMTAQAILTLDEYIGAYAGGDGSTCGLSYPLLGSNPGFGTGTWTKTNGTGTATFEDVNDPFTTVHMSGVDSFGIKEFTWTIVSGVCTSSDAVVVTFNGPPVVTCSPDITVCKGVDPFFYLPPGSPGGGDFSGEYTSGSVFYLFAPPGEYPITYHYVDPGTGCEGTCTFNLTLFESPTISPGYYGPVCRNAPDVMLIDSPSGGTYSGLGVSGDVDDGFVFDPSVGTQNIMYSYTDPVTGCFAGTNQILYVFDVPTLNLGIYPPVCLSSPPVALNAAPFGGEWTGTGVSGDAMSGFFFDPSAGTQTLTYTFTTEYNCIVSDSVTIIATEALAVICPEDFDYCIAAGILDLSTLNVQPAGGMFAGDGVTGNLFDPVAAGLGETLITYSYDYMNECAGSCSFTITVLPDLVEEVSAGMYPEHCVNDGAVVLDQGTPAGGVWTGYGVDGNQMDGYVFYTYYGSATLTYSVTGPNGCASGAQVDIVVNPNPSPYFIPQEACSDEMPFLLDAAQPFSENGVYSGTGVNAANIFDPSIESGFYFLDYTVTDENGCSGGGSFPMQVYDPPMLSCPSTPITMDVDDPPLLLIVSSPEGGYYSGIGMIGKSFYPAVADVGTHTITYTLTVGIAACQVACTFQIIVLPANPCPHDFSTCTYSSPVDLTTLEGNGGSYTGNGVTMNVFNPSEAGPGDHTITHTYDIGSGEMTCTFVITVAGPPVVTCPADFVICGDQYGTFNLSGGMPEGGYYTGDYIYDGYTFYAQWAGLGIHPITYNYTDPVTGCTNTCTFNITVIFENQIDAGIYGIVCAEDGDVVLTGYPAGGTFTGNGVSGDVMNGFVFDPSVGTTTVSYSFPDPIAMCNTVDDALITVVSGPPVVECPVDMTMCLNGPAILLTATPAGGTYSGSIGIVNGNMFDPSVVGVGEHMITYTYPPSGSCSATCSFIITVIDLPTVSCPSSIEVCIASDPFELVGGTPSGGTYSGDGVLNGYYFPGYAGVGFHSIQYMYTDPVTMCSQNCTFYIQVVGPPMVGLGYYGPVCSDSAPIGLMASPNYGVWTGTGVTGDLPGEYVFDPSVGTQTLTYTVTEVENCTTSATLLMVVNEPPPPPDCPEDMTFCSDAPIFILAPVSEGGLYYPKAGIFIDGANWVFDASAITGIPKTIDYSYTVQDVNTGCSSTCYFAFTVNPLPEVACPGDMQVDINAAPFALTGGMPLGGTYDGDGVTDGIFDPAAAGVDVHSIQYTYTDPMTGCTNHCFFDIEVTSGECNPPIVNTSPMPQHICQNTSAMFSASFTGSAPITYQWEYSDDGGMTWYPVPNDEPYTGETTTSLTITTPTLQYDDYQYRLRATNVCGEEVTEAATLTLDQFFEAIAGDDNATCSLVYNLLGNDQGFATGTWTMTSGTGMATFGNINDSETTVTMSGMDPYGTKEFTWTIVNGLCSSSDAVLITFNEPTATPLCPGNYSVCIDTMPIMLTGGFPAGGTYSGDGVTAGVFTASVAGVGPHVITYSLPDENGCVGTCSFTITVKDMPVLAGCLPLIELCLNNGLYSLLDIGITPIGGMFSGVGVTGNNFNPLVTGPGLHPVSYLYTDPTSGCSATCNFNMQVDDLPIVSAGSYGPVCLNGPDVALNGTPPDGVWSGIGVSGTQMIGYVFDPSVGTQTLTYTVVDINNCSNTASTSIMVNTPIPPLCPGSYSVCIDTMPIMLTGGFPAGGTYSGDGVIVGVFTASVAGVGPHVITYTMSDGNGCTSTCSFTITVNALPVVTCPASTPVCIDAAPYALTGAAPVGGTYSGVGVSMGFFNPSVAGVGSHVITYTYTDPVTTCTNSCTFTITVNALPIETCPPDFSIPIDFPIFLLTGGFPASGNYSGDGVSANNFNPILAGVGPHLITYSFTNAGGCTNTCTFTITVNPEAECSSTMSWVFLPPGTSTGACTSESNCCEDVVCYGLQYTPGHSGVLEDYTTGFIIPCPGPNSPIISNMSCVMADNSFEISGCGPPNNSLLFNSSGFEGSLPVTACVPVILHKVCFSLPLDASVSISEDVITDLTANIQLSNQFTVSEFPTYTTTTLTRPTPVSPDDDGESIACPQDAIPPVYPEVLDYCGSPIQATLLIVVDTPNPLTCEGTRVYHYEYMECSGYTFDWNYTYTIIRNDFAVPENGNSQVACASAATVTNVIVPELTSDCNETLTITGPVTNQFESDTYDSCDGTISYTWTFTDCAMHSHTWTYTFDVQPTPPAELGGPVPTSSTIDCYLEAVAPALPVIQDACGNTLVLSGPVIGGTNNGGCNGTITYTYSYMDCDGVTYPWVYTYSVSCESIVLKVWLEGAYNTVTNDMKTTMNTLHTLPGQNAPLFYIDYPAGQPYNIAPWNYNGMPSNTGTQWGDFGGQTPYPPGVVDWILVMIRKGGITPAFTIWTCAGWVHQNGDVTFPESCPLPAFTTDDYYFVVQHRNHLGILSPAEVDMPCGTAMLEWDFRNSNSYQPLFRFGQKEVEPGVWAMYSGNGEQAGSISAINSLDRTLWRTLQGVHGYNLGDFDLNAFTDGFDETLWKNNQNKTTGVVFY